MTGSLIIVKGAVTSLDVTHGENSIKTLSLNPVAIGYQRYIDAGKSYHKRNQGTREGETG